MNPTVVQAPTPGNRSCAYSLGNLLAHGGLPLAGVVAAYVTLSVIGITWGLPSRSIDKYLFNDGEPWSGKKIFDLAGGSDKLSDAALRTRGADVDADPIEGRLDAPVRLNATESDIARIYLRYRLYTYQPDEMITMMALSGMRPGRLQLDPRLYQYGGLFVYPIGALIKFCGAFGLIDVRPDVVFYLDHPDEFGKFYVVARVYVLAWGALGVIAVYAVARRLSIALFRTRVTDQYATLGESPDAATWRSADHAGLFAAVLFAIMPVVVCMSHEAKPHLPGAVLMLLAVLCAMRSVNYAAAATNGPSGDFATRPSRMPRDFGLTSVCCGAAIGMVLSSLPILILIPLTALLQRQTHRSLTVAARLRLILWGLIIAACIYFLTNPYVLLNIVRHPDILRSNFGNSVAMYEVGRVREGLLRVTQLTVEGARYPVVILGTIGLLISLIRRGGPRPETLLLALPAVFLFLQFVLLGAGKPAEYGRFGVFTNSSLAIFAGCVTAVRWRRARFVAMKAVRIIVIARVAMIGGAYLWGFHLDSCGEGSRILLSESLVQMNKANSLKSKRRPRFALLAEPAPYSCPPTDFSKIDLFLARTPSQIEKALQDRRCWLIQPVDPDPNFDVASFAPAHTRWSWTYWLWRPTPISWANKPFVIERGKLDAQDDDAP